MATTSNARPINTLIKSVNSDVIVRLKSNYDYQGRMVRCDSYMNIILDKATEYNKGKLVANYGNIFIRGNNILWIRLLTEL